MSCEALIAERVKEFTLIASDLFPIGGFFKDTDSASKFDFFNKRESTSLSLEAISLEI